MIRMRIKNIIVGTGPLPSAVVLRPAEAHEGDGYDDDPIGSAETPSESGHKILADELPIGMGTFDAACIARGVDGVERVRPMTHELLWSVIEALEGSLESVSILRLEGTTFFASLDVRSTDGAAHHIDARPSDAIALAVRAGVPILAREDVLERGGMPNFEAIAQDERDHALSEFHDFVEKLSPEDFRANDTR